MRVDKLRAPSNKDPYRLMLTCAGLELLGWTVNLMIVPFVLGAGISGCIGERFVEFGACIKEGSKDSSVSRTIIAACLRACVAAAR